MVGFGIPVAPAEVIVLGSIADKADFPLRFKVVGSIDCGSAIIYPCTIPKLLSQFTSVTGVKVLTSTLVGGV
jgi:hypothetical protein